MPRANQINQPVSPWSYQSFQQLLKELVPRPNSGSFIKDFLYLILIGFFQTTILPCFTPLGLQLDFITPWVIVTSIRQRVLPSTLLAVTGALILETRSTVPGGMYVITYWITNNIIIQMRPTLSWRHQIPWFVTFLVASLWVHLFEVFVVFISRGSGYLTLAFFLQQAAKVLSSTLFGMYICQKWLTLGADNAIAQNYSH